MATINDYQRLITSEHADKPNYMATIGVLCQPFVDEQNVANTMPALEDLDTAIGDQLDADGEWVGISRQIATPLTGVYFTWDGSGPGWDNGTWWAVGQPTTQLISLPDDAYRNIIRAKIAFNHWDGTVPGAYTIWGIVFAPIGLTFLIQDNQDGSITYVILAENLDAVTLGLIQNGYFDLRPAGIRITGYFIPGTPGLPIFGYDLETSSVKGWDEGAWLEEIV